MTTLLKGRRPPSPLARPAREQSRVRYPDESGYVDREGVRLYYEVYGAGEPQLFLSPLGWPILHSRMWKAQIPYLARRHRLVTYDPRGNGRSDRPDHFESYVDQELVADALAVLDATNVRRSVLVQFAGETWQLRLLADHPDRFLGTISIHTCVPRLTSPLPEKVGIAERFEIVLDTDEGWAKENRHYRLRDHRGYLEFFMSRCATEPHSTKLIEDLVGWGLDTDAETLLLSEDAGPDPTRADVELLCERVRATRLPVLVAQGTDDGIMPFDRGQRLAALTGGEFVALEGSGHASTGRDPVRVNLMIEEFADSISGRTRVSDPSPRTWTRALRRPRRALYVSSPIGLGHAQRDVGIASELRKLHPDLEIDWLAQHPVTAVLETRGERIHPLSAELASESAHIAAESSGHSLNAFQAIRRMDEILVANFMVFYDAVTDGDYDLVVGDEAWDIDYYFHENPELKRTAFAWMTDFVGWLPMPEGGDREAFLTADYNAEMIEHVERFPRIRDRAIFVGEPDDIVSDDFGPGLPSIRTWTEDHYDFSGYVTGFDPTPLIQRREELRRELGYHDDERVVIVTVGGSGVGESLLKRVVASYPMAARRVNGLRMIAVAGPRIDPRSIDAPPSVEVRGFVPRLYEHLAVCDLAVVQGGLTTTMELVAGRRPFIYFPLRNHFEQNRHVRHRLDRYRAGRCMDYAESDPDAIAAAIAEEIDRVVDYRPVATDGAGKAAALIAPLI
jgi:pimeloyl-ACP methyl ester carboxylesterase/predicted glycosyltransferase